MLKRVWIPSPNHSSRQGATVRILVLHTAEGALTFQSLGNFFSSSAAGVSSHVGIDDTPNTIGEYVRADKAWTCANYNPVSVNAELCGFASWGPDDWAKHEVMLSNTAKWVREECDRYGIPCVALTPSQAQGGGRGVCQHADLGSAGGGHWDCGPHFPLSDVLRMANGQAPASTPTPPKQGDQNMVASGVADNGTTHVFWADDDKQTVRFRYQQKGKHEWVDGGVLAKAPKKIAGLSATKTATGTLELFARYEDASVAHVWQNAGKSAWSGGEAGQQVAEFAPLPKAP